MDSHLSCGRSLLNGLLGFLTAVAPAAWAQSIPNPSFEADAYTAPPGYANDNGGGMTGWVLSDPTRIGLNPASGSLFADNGATPHGTNIAFVQSTGGTSTLSTTITGLTPDVLYRVSFRANRRAAFDTPNPSWSLNGGPFVPFTAAPAVGGSSPYYTNSADFTATNNTAALVIRNQSAGDATVLVDDFSIATIPTVVVANTNDNGPGSLRQVIVDAAGGAAITFASNLSGSTILLTTGELLLNKDLTIDASALPAGLQMNGNRASRIFKVASNATVVLNALTITNGYAAEGGGIYNAGNLTLNHSSVAGNSARGAAGSNGNTNGSSGGAGGPGSYVNGGGVYNLGSLAVSHSTFSGNSATGGAGGNGGTNGGPGGIGGDGNGSGIYNLGSLAVSHSTFSGNSATGGAGGNGGTYSSSGGPGGNGNGGGIYNMGSLTVNQSILSGNSATGGTGGGGAISGTTGGGWGGTGGNGKGGGIHNAATLKLDQSTLSANSASGGGGGFGGRGSDGTGGYGGTGGDGDGGGIYNAGTVTANKSTLSGNSAAGGFGGRAGDAFLWGGVGGLGGNGNGGGMHNAGTLTVDQSTLSGNSAAGGYGGYGGYGHGTGHAGRGGNGGNGNGGGGYNRGTLMMNQSTLSGNSVTGGLGGPGASAGSPVAGGIYQTNALILFNSIVAGNIPSEFFGAFTATGNNVTIGNPLLAPLGQYGGATKTRPPMPGSPAINAGAATSFTNDQRGFPRPLGPAPDIGAVEGVFNTAIPLANLTRLANGTFQLAITSFSGPSHSVLAGTNVALPLNTWSNLGLAMELPPGSGQFQFTDLQATNYAQRFYRASVP